MRAALNKFKWREWAHHTRRHARLLEYLHDWIGESGYDYDPRLLLRSPLLVGWVDRRAKRGGLRLGRPLCLTAGRGDARLFLLEGSYLRLAWTTFSHQLHGAHQDDRPSSRGDRTNWH